MSISIIVAIARNNVIGNEQQLPWHIPEDLKYFKKQTLGKSVIMGRKTFESIMHKIGKPLPDRQNIVITNQFNYAVPKEVMVVNSLEQAVAASEHDVFVIGGQSIYELALPQAQYLYVTEIEQEVVGDTFFPQIPDEFAEVSRDNRDGFSFVIYQRSLTNKEV